MRWLCMLAIVGMAAQAHADGCRVTTPSGQILFVREVSATLAPPQFRLQPHFAKLATAQSSAPTVPPQPTAPPAPTNQRPATDSIARTITGVTLGQLISDPLRRQIGLDIVGLQTAQPRVIIFLLPAQSHLIVDLELRVDDCAPTDA